MPSRREGAPAITNEDRARYLRIAREKAREYYINEGVFIRMITRESRWDPYAISDANAEGIAQIKTDGHPEMAVIGDDGHRLTFDPEAALDYAARKLAEYVAMYVVTTDWRWPPGTAVSPMLVSRERFFIRAFRVLPRP
jgi:soluble lytic murein transglycosylase-like protein